MLRHPSTNPNAAGRLAEGWRRLWRSCVATAVMAVALFGQSGTRAQEAEISEYQVKAAWMLNFARFVEWPAAAFRDTQAPIVVGILGRDPFGKDLEQAFARKVVKGRSFVIRRLTGEADLAGCHVLFIADAERKRTREVLEKVTKLPVLTVGESTEFLEHGGVINFLLKDKSIRFEINLKAAQAAGLKLDANLLKVAVAVRGKYD